MASAEAMKEQARESVKLQGIVSQQANRKQKPGKVDTMHVASTYNSELHRPSYVRPQCVMLC